MQVETCDPIHHDRRENPETGTLPADRISALPDQLLLHILSLLPMNEAFQTTFLSKQWQHLQNHVYNLTFSYRGSRKAEFVDFINKTIARYGDSSVKKFEVSLDFKSSKFFCYRDLYSWVQFAITQSMEELAFEWHFNTDCVDYCALPRGVYVIESLKSLSLRMCNVCFDLNASVSLKSLKRLTIGFSVLRNVAIRNMLRGSPVLEYFELCCCGSTDNLCIVSSSLKVLVIRDFRYLEVGNFPNPHTKTNDYLILEIRAPNLISMEILGTWYRECRVINVPSLLCATLDFDRTFYCPDVESGYEKCKELTELLQRLCHVENLTIGASCLETLGAAALQRLSSATSKRRFLTLDAYIRNWHLPGIASILASSPNLETLVLRTTSPYIVQDAGLLAQNNTFSEKMYSSQLEDRNILLRNLKTVSIFGWRTADDGSLPTLLLFLQKNARLLGKNLFIQEGVCLDSAESLLQAAARTLPVFH